MRTGLLGGTFDPIHVAHLHLAETALWAARLDRVVFVPAGDPWQKADRVVTPAAHRVEMVNLGIAGSVGFEVDLREVTRAGPTYTIDTLESFPSDEQLYLIVGADTAAGVGTWHRHRDVVARARFLILPRSGTDTGTVSATLPGSEVIDMATLDVSSTAIREMARTGKPFRYLVPEAVHDYIEANNLYGSDQVHPAGKGHG